MRACVPINIRNMTVVSSTVHEIFNKHRLWVSQTQRECRCYKQSASFAGLILPYNWNIWNCGMLHSAYSTCLNFRYKIIFRRRRVRATIIEKLQIENKTQVAIIIFFGDHIIIICWKYQLQYTLIQYAMQFLHNLFMHIYVHDPRRALNMKSMREFQDKARAVHQSPAKEKVQFLFESDDWRRVVQLEHNLFLGCQRFHDFQNIMANVCNKNELKTFATRIN